MAQENQQQQSKAKTDIAQKEVGAEKKHSPSGQIKLLDRILPSLSKLHPWWDNILVKVRSWLPESVNNQLNDLALTGVISTLVVIVLLTTVTILPAQEEEVVELPPEAISTPLELNAPNPPQALANLAPPTPEFTPEQSLIAAVQHKVDQMTQDYSQDLVESIVTSFASNTLTIQVADNWYQLADSEQNQLVQEMFHSSQTLDFPKLEIKNNQGTLVARNPVVGKNMVILQRHTN